MVGAKTRVATNINKIGSHAHLTYCHGYALRSAVGETIKAIKMMRSTLNASFELNKLIKYSIVDSKKILIKYSVKREGAANRLRQGTTPKNSGDRIVCSNRWTVRRTFLQSILDN